MDVDSGSYVFDTERAGKRRDRVAEALLGKGMSTEPVQHWTQGLARAFQGGMGGYLANQDQERERGQEQAFLGSVQGMLPEGDDPTRTYLQTILRDPRYREAGMQLVNALAKKKLGASDAEAPSNVREWEYYNSLSPEQQQQYLGMKRADKFLDMGTHFAQPNPAVPGDVAATYQKDLAGAEAQKEIGTAEGKAVAGAPSAISKAQGILQTIQQARDHPRREAGTGTSAYLPSINAQTRDFDNIVAQLQGQSFLQAFESLKGGGQITEIEGKQATDAIARLQQTGSEEGFLAALNDLEAVVRTGLQRAQAAGGGPAAPPGGGASDPMGLR